MLIKWTPRYFRNSQLILSQQENGCQPDRNDDKCLHWRYESLITCHAGNGKESDVELCCFLCCQFKQDALRIMWYCWNVTGIGWNWESIYNNKSRLHISLDMVYAVVRNWIMNIQISVNHINPAMIVICVFDLYVLDSVYLICFFLALLTPTKSFLWLILTAPVCID